MSIYNITYFISDTTGCGCGDHEHDHNHSHADSCGCGHDHNHNEENTSCGCNHDHKHDEEHSCGCNQDHEHHHADEEVDSEVIIQAKIKSFGAWAQVMPESFIVKSDLSSKEIYDELKSVSNAGDILLVSKIDPSEVAYENEALIEWLNK